MCNKLSVPAAMSMISTATGASRFSRSLRQRLLRGEKSYGSFLLSDSPIIAEIMALVGYDHVIIDHEHCPTDIRSGQVMLQAIDAAQQSVSYKRQHRTESIVRVPSASDAAYMKKVLDSIRLPAGVLVPLVEDATMAEYVVQCTRYPQQLADNKGIRGCAAPLVRSNSWGITDTIDEYIEKCQKDLLVMVQVETVKGVDNIAEIAAVDGIDAIFLGPLDLSASIGRLGQMNDPAVLEIIKATEQTIRNTGCLLAGYKPPNRNLNTMFHHDGYSLICGSADIGMLRDAALNDVQIVRNAVANTYDDDDN